MPPMADLSNGERSAGTVEQYGSMLPAHRGEIAARIGQGGQATLKSKAGAPIVVPLDGSKLSERAIPYAACLARATGSPVVLVRGFTEIGVRLSRMQPREEAATYHAIAAAARDQAERKLARIVERLGAEGVAASWTLGEGVAENVILAEATSSPGRIVVMATHGRGGLGRWIHGSVADEMVRRSDVPVLLVPGTCAHVWAEDRPFRVLVPLDGSGLAEEVMQTIAVLAPSLRAEVHLFRAVVPPDYVVEGAAVSPEYFDPAKEIPAALDYLRNVASRFPGLNTSTHAAVGEPVPTIEKAVRTLGIDLVAMVTHGRGGPLRLAIGSVATSTALRATVPVLLVRPPSVARARARHTPGEAAPPKLAEAG